MPGAVPTAHSAARIVSALGYIAPPSMTSAAPTPTRHAPKVSGCSKAWLAAVSVGNLSGRLDRSREIIVRRRSEEHTSELQSQSNLVCRLLLEKKKKKTIKSTSENVIVYCVRRMVEGPSTVGSCA